MKITRSQLRKIISEAIVTKYIMISVSTLANIFEVYGNMSGDMSPYNMIKSHPAYRARQEGTLYIDRNELMHEKLNITYNDPSVDGTFPQNFVSFSQPEHRLLGKLVKELSRPGSANIGASLDDIQNAAEFVFTPDDMPELIAKSADYYKRQGYDDHVAMLMAQGPMGPNTLMNDPRIGRTRYMRGRGL